MQAVWDKIRTILSRYFFMKIIGLTLLQNLSFHVLALWLRLRRYSNIEEPLSNSRLNTTCPSSFIK